jgi:hypothetical protein
MPRVRDHVTGCIVPKEKDPVRAVDNFEAHRARDLSPKHLVSGATRLQNHVSGEFHGRRTRPVQRPDD